MCLLIGPLIPLFHVMSSKVTIDDYLVWLRIGKLFQISVKEISRNINWLKCWFTKDFILGQILYEVKDLQAWCMYMWMNFHKHKVLVDNICGVICLLILCLWISFLISLLNRVPCLWSL